MTEDMNITDKQASKSRTIHENQLTREVFDPKFSSTTTAEGNNATA